MKVSPVLMTANRYNNVQSQARKQNFNNVQSQTIRQNSPSFGKFDGFFAEAFFPVDRQDGIDMDIYDYLKQSDTIVVKRAHRRSYLAVDPEAVKRSPIRKSLEKIFKNQRALTDFTDSDDKNIIQIKKEDPNAMTFFDDLKTLIDLICDMRLAERDDGSEFSFERSARLQREGSKDSGSSFSKDPDWFDVIDAGYKY